MTDMQPRKLKVLLTVHCFFPKHYHGTERYTLDLAKCLQRFGHEVVVVTPNRYDEDATLEEWREYEFEGVRVLAVDLTHHYPTGIAYTYVAPHLEETYKRILAQEQPDLVHCCHLLYNGANFISVAKAMGLPVILSLTDFFGICWTNTLTTIGGAPCSGPGRFSTNCVRDFYTSRSRVTNSDLLNRFLHFARHALPAYGLFQLWANSGLLGAKKLRPPIGDIQNRREVIRDHFQKADEYFVATNIVRDAFLAQGYDSKRFTKLTFGIPQPGEDEKNGLRDRYVRLRDSGEPFVIGFIGQIARHKGILDLIAAFQAANLENAELHIYGDLGQDPKAGPLVRKAAEADGRIKLLGTFPGGEIYRVLTSIHVLVIPSTWHENAPLVLLNALASRTMLLVSSGKGLVEFIDEGKNGFVFPMGDVAALEERLLAMGRARHTLIEAFDQIFPYERSPEGYAREIEKSYLRHAKPPGSIRFPKPPDWKGRLINFRKVSPETPHAGEFMPLHDDRAYLTAPLPEARHYLLTRDRHVIDLAELPGFSRAATVRMRVAFHQSGSCSFHYDIQRRQQLGNIPQVHRTYEKGIYEIVIRREVLEPVLTLHWQTTSRFENARLSILEVEVLDAAGNPVWPDVERIELTREEWVDLSCGPAALDPRFASLVAPVPPREPLSDPGAAITRLEYVQKTFAILTAVESVCEERIWNCSSALEVTWGAPHISRLLHDRSITAAIGCETSRKWAQSALGSARIESLDFCEHGDETIFSRIFALHFFHYVPFEDWPKYFAMLGRMLVPGGTLLASYPSYRVVGRSKRGLEASSGLVLAGRALEKASAAAKREEAITLTRDDGLPEYAPVFTICPLTPLAGVLPSGLKIVRHELGGLERAFDLLLLRRKENI